MNVCPPASPAASQNAAGSGRVATISEYTGTTERGASCADHASVARTTVRRRDDAAVGHHPARPDRGGGRALDDAPAAALDGPRETPHEPRGLDPRAVRRERAAQHAGGADQRRRGVGVGTKPGSARARRSCAGVRARATVPPFTQSQAMPSSATALPTSSTVSRIAAPIAQRRRRGRAGGQRGLARREQRRAPAAVAPARAEPAICAPPRARAGPGRRAAGGRPSRAR